MLFQGSICFFEYRLSDHHLLLAPIALLPSFLTIYVELPGIQATNSNYLDLCKHFVNSEHTKLSWLIR
jgi:hypothetical protein